MKKNKLIIQKTYIFKNEDSIHVLIKNNIKRHVSSSFIQRSLFLFHLKSYDTGAKIGTYIITGRGVR